MRSKTQFRDSSKNQPTPHFRLSPPGALQSAETQRFKILVLLQAARGAWMPLPKIMACAAQYNARIFELRRMGFNIENRTERVDGVRHSWFRLVGSTAPAPKPTTLFDLSRDPL